MNSNISNLKPGTITGNLLEGVLQLQAWAGFQKKQDNYAGKIPEGTVKVYIRGKEMNQSRVLTEAQANTIRFLAENDEKIRDVLLNGILKDFPRLKENYGHFIPDIENATGFKDHIRLETLYVSPSDKDGFSYTGFGFTCSWDEEHGAGVMMHKDRVVKVGAADTATDDWATFEDNGTAEAETKKWNESAVKQRMEKEMNKSKKPWWKLFF